MAEGQQPLTRAQMMQLERELMEQVLDRAQSDPEWRQLYIEDPELAMREANFPASQQLAQAGAAGAPEEAEVVGQHRGHGGGRGHGHGGHGGGHGGGWGQCGYYWDYYYQYSRWYTW